MSFSSMPNLKTTSGVSWEALENSIIRDVFDYVDF